MEELLGPIVEHVERSLSGRDVLEIACGTGNWTQVLAERVKRVLATDISETAIARARGKEYANDAVEFRIADAYSLNDVSGGFTGGFAADWWSHVPRSLLPTFLATLHGRLEPQARVVFIDMLPRDHPDLTPYRQDADGNLICRRSLPDGRTFDVVKNFPSQDELLGVAADVGEQVEYHEWSELGRWLLAYSVAARPHR